MLVVMPVMFGVPATIMDVIDVITMWHCYVPASLAVIVIVIVVSGVPAGFTLVEVSVVRFV